MTEQTAMPSEDEILESLKVVEDPEIGFSIVELGLVYDIEIKEDKGVNVTMTLTSPFCPVGPYITEQVEQVVSGMPGVEHVNVDITFTPPWDPKTMAGDEVKMLLGIW